MISHPKRPRGDPNQLAKSIIDRVTGQQPSPVQGVTGKNSAEVPNMTQRTVLQCLNLGDWKIVAAGQESAWELYDLSRDRAESKNLAAKKPDKVRELAAQWTRLTKEFSALARKE